jgi:ankyrin repeat protein
MTHINSKLVLSVLAVIVLILFYFHTLQNKNINEEFIRANVFLYNGNTNALVELLDKNPELINERSLDDNSTLLHAACTRCPSAIEILLKYRSEPNATNVFGRTPLHNLYIYSSYAENIVPIMTYYGSATNILDIYGKRPIEYKAEIEYDIK